MMATRRAATVVPKENSMINACRLVESIEFVGETLCACWIFQSAVMGNGEMTK